MRCSSTDCKAITITTEAEAKEIVEHIQARRMAALTDARNMVAVLERLARDESEPVLIE
jgi:hypothetical protein